MHLEKPHPFLGLSSKALLLAVLIGFGSFSISQAHDPIFGLGPRTLWLHGFGFEAQLEIQRYTQQAVYEMEYIAHYGVTTNWTVTLAAP